MFRNPVEQLLGELCSELAYIQVDDLIAAGLHEYLDQLQTRMNGVEQRHPRDLLRDPGPRPQEGEGTNDGAPVGVLTAHGHSRRPVSQDRVPLRPSGLAGAARHSIAPGTALPDADPELRAPGHATEALHQLATGSAQQFPRAPGLSRADARLVDRGRSGGRDVGAQSVRFLPRAIGRAVAVPVRALAGQGPRAIPGGAGRRSTAARVSRDDRPRRHPHHRLPGRHQSPAVTGGRLHHPARTGRAGTGRDAHARTGLVPRHGLVAGAGSAASRLRRALRVRISDPARAGREIAGGSGRTRRGLHRPARVGRGLSARCGLDRARSHLGPARRRRPHSTRRHAGTRERRAGDRRGGRLRGDVLARDERAADLRVPAGDPAVHGRAMAADRIARP